MLTFLEIPVIFGLSIEVHFILLILAFPSYFFWRWLLKKFIKNDKSLKRNTWIGTILFTPILYVGIVLFFIFIVSLYPSHDFQKNKWLENREKRYEYSEDLIESKVLIGKTKSEIIEILGKESNNLESNFWTYELGFKPGLFNIDPDVLTIIFENNKVIKVEQHGT